MASLLRTWQREALHWTQRRSLLPRASAARFVQPRWFSRQTGVVVKWDEERGFGKVKTQDGRELFVHKSYLLQTPMMEGQNVNFEVRWNEKQKQNHAMDVGIADAAPATGAHSSTSQLTEMVANSAKTLPQPELIQVEPINLPPDATDRQHLEMMTAQMEQLRRQGLQSQQLLVQNQQLLVQGLFALIQQQSIQNANLERALRALTDRMGDSPGQPTVAPKDPQRSLEATQAEAKVTTQLPLPTEQANDKVPAADSKDLGAQVPHLQPDSGSKRAADAKEPQQQEESQIEAKEEEVKQSKQEDVEESMEEEVEQVAPSQADEAPRPVDEMVPDQKMDPPSKEIAEASPPPSFYIVGSFNDWSADSELMQSGSASVTIRSSAPMGSRRGMQKEEFQILEDGSWDKRLFPAGGTSETVVVLRPGRFSAAERSSSENPGHGRNWAVEGKPGASFRIVYQPTNGRVTCEHA